MYEAVLFDTAAFLTLTGDEAGADEVNALLIRAMAGEVVLHAYFVTLTEIEYITLQKTDEATAATGRCRSRSANYVVAPFGCQRCVN